MGTISSSFKKSDSLLSVSLSSSGLLKEGEHIGRVTRNTVSLENLIAEISEVNTGLDPYVIQHSAILLQQQILKSLRQGKGVNILDLGTMYIGVNGIIKGNAPGAADIPDLAIRFTPSHLSNSALENIVIDKVVFSDNSPQISIITNLWTNEENKTITPGKTCRVKGSQLKLGGNEYSISFIPIDAEGNEDSTKQPVPVEESKIFKNTGTELNFFVPEEGFEQDTCYILRIVTSYLSATSSRKTPVSTDSEVLVVG